MISISQPKHVELLLHKNDLVSLDDLHAGTVIHCKNGALWITRTNDYEDYTLVPGDRYVTSKNGKVLIQSVGESTVYLSESGKGIATKFSHSDSWAGSASAAH